MFKKRNKFNKPLTRKEALDMSKSILEDFENVTTILERHGSAIDDNIKVYEDILLQNTNLKLVLKSLISLELNIKTKKELNKKVKITDKESFKLSELYILMLETLI